MGTNFTDIATNDPVIAATINDRLDQLDAAIQAGIGGIILTNKSGGALAANDAVVIDTANNEAVTTTTGAGDVNRPGVVIAGGANNAEVTVSLLGEVTVVVDGAGSRGQWIKTSTTAKQVTPVATLDEGVFGLLTGDSSGGVGTTATALLLGGVVVRPGGAIAYFAQSEHVSASTGAGDAGKPVVLDADGRIDSSMLGILTGSNLLINGAFDHWQRSTDDTAVTTTRKYVADRWAVKTGANTLAHVQRSTTVRTGARSKYSMQLDGAASVTTVDVDQRLEAALSGLYKTTVSFSAWVYNESGAAFTPKLFVSTPSAADNWASSTVRNGGGSGEDLQECADSEWTWATWAADISGYTNIDNGLEVRLQIPSGSLVAGDIVRLAEMNLVADSVPAVFSGRLAMIEEWLCQRYFWQHFYNSTLSTVAYGRTVGTTKAQATIPTPVTMRSLPTISSRGEVGILTDVIYGDVSSIAALAVTPLGVLADFNTVITMTANQVAIITIGDLSPPVSMAFDSEL